MATSLLPTMGDATSLIETFRILDAGDDSSMPHYQKLYLTSTGFSRVVSWLQNNPPLPSSARNNLYINRNPTTRTLTLHYPSALQRAFLSRVNAAIARQFAVLRARGGPFAYAVRQIAFYQHFAMGTTPPGGVTYLDGCYRLQSASFISVAMTIVGKDSRDNLREIVEGILVKGDRRVKRLVVLDIGPWDDSKVQDGFEVVADKKRATVQQWRMEPREKDANGLVTWVPKMMGDELVFRGNDVPAQGMEDALVLSMQLFRGEVFTGGKESDGSELFPVWKQDIRISLNKLRKILEQEEAKDAHNQEDWDMAEVDGEDDWDLVVI